MSRIVLVHGAWHGAWCWEEVQAGLRARGHTVETPVLTGVGERADELGPHVGLATHVEDVVRAVAGGPPCVLVGHSYAGLVVRQAADRAPDRVERIVLVDGWLGGDGVSLFDLAPQWFADGLRRAARERGEGWWMPAPAPALVGVTEPEQAARLETLLTAHPLRTFEDASRLTGAVDGVPGAAIVCRPGAGLPFDAMAEAQGLRVVDIESAHDAMVIAPEALTALLHAEAS